MSEIRTVEELAALPLRSVLLGKTAELGYAEEWRVEARERGHSVFPLTLLYRPDLPSQAKLVAERDAALAGERHLAEIALEAIDDVEDAQTRHVKMTRYDEHLIKAERRRAEYAEEAQRRTDKALQLAYAERNRLRAAVDEVLALHQRNPAPTLHWEPCLEHIPNRVNRERAGGWKALQDEMDACSVCTSSEHWHCTYDTHGECGHEDYPCATASDEETT